MKLKFWPASSKRYVSCYLNDAILNLALKLKSENEFFLFYLRTLFFFQVTWTFPIFVFWISDNVTNEQQNLIAEFSSFLT